MKARMSERRLRYRTGEENAVAQLADSLRCSTWSGGTDSQVWNSKIAKLEEKVVVARRYAANMLEIAEEAESYAEKIESLPEVRKVVEVASHLRIMWGSAVHHARLMSTGSWQRSLGAG